MKEQENQQQHKQKHLPNDAS